MPYINQERRAEIDPTHENDVYSPETTGELNYVLTKLVLEWVGYSPHYSDFNEAMGVLECVKQELYRRMVAPYEDEKKEENGDVYPEMRKAVPIEDYDPYSGLRSKSCRCTCP